VAELEALSDEELLARAEAHLAQGVNGAIAEALLEGIWLTQERQRRAARRRRKGPESRK
jgi:hypothetical protein